MAAIYCPTPSRKRPQFFSPAESPEAAAANGCYGSPSAKRYRKCESSVSRLRSLFPGMDDDTLRCVLDSCSQDVDLAIEKLTRLRVVEPPPPPKAVVSKAAKPPEDPEDWVDAFVDEMSKSRDVADAKARASRALAAFERFVEQRNGDKVARLEKENALLKRAVSIQAQRLAEARDSNAHHADLLAKLHDKLKQAELQNYSLSVHLKHGFQPPFPPNNGCGPDVF
mmetsp:Transcript_37043/g.118780  ORF Transcript_37043/g.118780 Transcript_37043/m.118780 type:complete len:225 (-) Transcript_37043:355-1029(-)